MHCTAHSVSISPYNLSGMQLWLLGQPTLGARNVHGNYAYMKDVHGVCTTLHVVVAIQAD